MRLYFLLITTAISMAFVTGYIALFIQGSHHATASDVIEINQIKQNFQRLVSPRHIVNFNSLYYSKEHFQLIDPFYKISNPTMKSNQERYFSNKNCFEDFPKLVNQDNFEKIWLWEEFRCGKLDSLPRGFFLNPPFLHPSGSSYAFLALKLKKAGYDNRLWVQNHLPFFHTLELHLVRNVIGPLDGIFGVLEKLDKDELAGLSRGKGTILTSNFLFARLTYPKVFSILEYRIYDRKDLNKFLENGPFVLMPYREGEVCFYRDGSICWEYNLQHIFTIANNSTLGLFLGLIIIIFVVVRLLMVKIKNQRFEDEKRRLALRVLAHEFRTPVTSLLLLIEKMSKNYDQFDESMEEVYLRLSSEVHRLKRLTDTSRHYLKADQNKKLLNLNFEQIPSLNDFIEDIISPFKEMYGDQVIYNPLKEDLEWNIDQYWLGICVKNLIDNACIHGELPVEVFIECKNDHLLICVQDNGVCDFSSLEEMTEEFVKGTKSTGTGLGMNIVKKVIHELGGKFELSHRPTMMKLKIPKKKGNV